MKYKVVKSVEAGRIIKPRWKPLEDIIWGSIDLIEGDILEYMNPMDGPFDQTVFVLKGTETYVTLNNESIHDYIEKID